MTPAEIADATRGEPRSEPRVSVVIPAYNVEGKVEETIEAVAAQTYRDFELIVVDDGSTDTTPAVLERCAAKWPWMSWLRQDNAGASVARNAGVKHARGEYIALLDADDLWLPEKLAEQMPLFDLAPTPDVVYADKMDFPDALRHGDRTLFQQKPPARGWILPQYFMGNFILTSSAVVRKAAYNAVAGFDPDLRFVEDVDFFMRLAEHHRFDYVDKVLVRYRLHPASESRRDAVDNQRGDLKVFDYWVERRPDLFPKNSIHVKQRYATVYARIGYTLLERGDYSGARRAYRSAIGLGLRNPDLLLRAAISHFPPLAALARRSKLRMR